MPLVTSSDPLPYLDELPLVQAGRRVMNSNSYALAAQLQEAGAEPVLLGIARDNRESLVLGHGPHVCLGAHLARQELGAMLDAALDIVPTGSHVREDLQEFAPMGFFKRPLNLPIEIPAD